ncbi:endoglucanase 16-like precursor [Gossypium hirsutum]|uniref:Endoglucanase n=1 Tax=Gossypium hirsutum TaxID=3635 RepID=A0A068EVA0_GOSHI|nr:endoglucanase 16-like precursor [Gossypium hirsutum]AID55389.1 glycoside hydrolase family 9 A5 [Gossypium hirsutum]
MGMTSPSAAALVAWLAVLLGYVVVVNGDNFNYKEALTKSLIFLEAQRSGKLPPNHRVAWRGDSCLNDGKEANMDLVGGYYDAGDNVKYGLPMAFTVTTLAWSAIVYNSELKSAGELGNTQAAIRWGTDYFLKAACKRNKLYVQVGDPEKEHQCWVRPENMKHPRPVLEINEKAPGTEIAAETSAALAASSIVFRRIDRPYARRLLNKAKMLFKFAGEHKGSFDGECPFYCSFSGYHDELLWAAAWLYSATRDRTYFKYVTEEALHAVVDEFNWDLKYAGVQILLSKSFFQGGRDMQAYKEHADSFICSALPQSPYHKIPMTPAGLVHLRDGANLQYATGISFLFSIYGDLLQRFNQKVQCGDKRFDSTHLLAFAKQQMDYILGQNPQGRSYMVGFGKNPPKQAHHRGASIPLSDANSEVNCPMSFVRWYNKNTPNPNELTGAILGGPDNHDKFNDERWSSVYTEPCTYINSLAVGALAKLTRPLPVK